jgi:integrase
MLATVRDQPTQLFPIDNPFHRANSATLRTLTDKTASLAPSVQRHVLAVAKILFRWGVRKGYLKVNPAEALQVKKQKGRKRFLLPHEIRQVWQACPDTPYGTVVKLLILTGQRREEVRRFELSGDVVTIDGQYVKTLPRNRR